MPRAASTCQHGHSSDPALKAALDQLISPDGRATYLLVYGDGHEWSGDGAHRPRQIETAVREATKEGTLTPTAVHLTGVGPATSDLQKLVNDDLTLLVVATLALIFLIVALLLRSPVAGIVVVGTVALSYASALGASVLIWQHLLGHDLHWAVAPISFIALVAVGADYNLLLAMRIREEAHAGLGTGIIRAFGATGGVVTTAGIVFGITMFALAGSSVLSIAQIGVTIGVGLMLDTLIVRTFVLPSLVALLGRWFWWPTMFSGRPIRRNCRMQGIGDFPCISSVSTGAGLPATIESPWTVTAAGSSGFVAGPFATDPSRLNLLPWHGQSMVPSATLFTVQPAWVQIAEKPLNSPAVGLRHDDLIDDHARPDRDVGRLGDDVGEFRGSPAGRRRRLGRRGRVAGCLRLLAVGRAGGEHGRDQTRARHR